MAPPCSLLTFVYLVFCVLLGTPPYFDVYGVQDGQDPTAPQYSATKKIGGKKRQLPVPLPAATDQRPCNFEYRGGCVLRHKTMHSHRTTNVEKCGGMPSEPRSSCLVRSWVCGCRVEAYCRAASHCLSPHPRSVFVMCSSDGPGVHDRVMAAAQAANLQVSISLFASNLPHVACSRSLLHGSILTL
jgi:hypothetical protein